MKNKNNSINIAIIFVLVYSLFFKVVVSKAAVDPGDGGGGGGGEVIEINNGPSLESCGIETAIGCIPVENTDALALFFLRWGMGLGGAIALIIMVIATYLIMSAAGNPDRLGAGKELFTSAASGLILLVFAAWILNFIGVQLLEIPALGG